MNCLDGLIQPQIKLLNSFFCWVVFGFFLYDFVIPCKCPLLVLQLHGKSIAIHIHSEHIITEHIDNMYCYLEWSGGVCHKMHNAYKVFLFFFPYYIIHFYVQLLLFLAMSLSRIKGKTWTWSILLFMHSQQPPREILPVVLHVQLDH